MQTFICTSVFCQLHAQSVDRTSERHTHATPSNLPLLAERRLGPLHVVDVRLEELCVAVVQLGVLALHLRLLVVQPGYLGGERRYLITKLNFGD